MRLVVEVPSYSRVLDGARSLGRKPHELLPGAESFGHVSFISCWLLSSRFLLGREDNPCVGKTVTVLNGNRWCETYISAITTGCDPR